MAGILAYLRPNETAAINECINRLIGHLDGCLVEAYLFGSKARGDCTPDSDLDLLIVLETDNWETKDEVRFIAADISLEYDVLINTHILSQARWKEMAHQQTTLWREVQRDGVLLLSVYQEVVHQAGLV
jgi:predicted nucleotidyltransferase